MQELLLKRNHLFFLHFFTNYCECQRMHMIIFCGPQAQISASKNGNRSEIFIGHTVCGWRTINRTAPIITGNVRRLLGNTAVSVCHSQIRAEIDILVVLLVVIGKLIKPQRLVFPLCSLVFLSSLPVFVLHNKVSKFLISHILSFPITCPV